jgi:hypothetical protein
MEIWKLEDEISDYPSDYKLLVEFSDGIVTITNEADGVPITTFEMSIAEAIKLGELAKKFKEATREK